MSDIELASNSLVADLTSFAAALQSATLEDAKAAHDKIKVAREWAKLQENAQELAERLVWLEAVLLRRIGQLDPKVLPNARRAAARHFAALDDSALSALLNDYPGKTAISAYNLWARANGIKKARKRGESYGLPGTRESATADDPDGISDWARRAIEVRNMAVREAAAVLVREFAGEIPAVSVRRVVDDFIDEEAPISPEADELEVTAFRRGLSAAVREAFLSAPVETTEKSDEIPAYITTYDREADEWVRIRSEFATVADARQMLELRRGQIETLQSSLAKLERILEGRFGVKDAEPEAYLRWDTTAMSKRLMAMQRYESATA